MKKIAFVLAAMIIMAGTTATAQRNDRENDAPEKEMRSEQQQKQKKAQAGTKKKSNVKTGVIQLKGKNAGRQNAVEAAKAVDGVKTAKYNAKTQKLTVTYDANKTDMNKIKQAVSKKVSKKEPEKKNRK